MENLGEFRERNPNGEVMAQPRIYRSYGANTYVGYDGSVRPFLYSGENPPFGIEPLSRVIRVGNRAWPLERLQDVDELIEAGVRIVWQSGMASALDTRRIADADRKRVVEGKRVELGGRRLSSTTHNPQ